jgi:hypothetical protein
MVKETERRKEREGMSQELGVEFENKLHCHINV